MRRFWPKAAQAKVLKTNKLRDDTTVVPANVAYPTDSGLLAKGVAKMANLRRRTGEAKDEVKAMNADTAALASKAVNEARRVAANARRTLRQLGDSGAQRTRRLVVFYAKLDISFGAPFDAD
jgi:transposase, IS5 family